MYNPEGVTSDATSALQQFGQGEIVSVFIM